MSAMMQLAINCGGKGSGVPGPCKGAGENFLTAAPKGDAFSEWVKSRPKENIPKQPKEVKPKAVKQPKPKKQKKEEDFLTAPKKDDFADWASSR